MTKICTKCGKSVEDKDNFCPYCRGTTFKNKYQVVEADNTPVHKMFYWNYGGRYRLSKSKITAVVVFLLFSVGALLSGGPVAMVFIALIFAGLTYLLGFGIHQMLGEPSKVQIEHNDYGLFTDLKHFFLYWQNKEGQYVLSKTKIISHMVFLAFFSIGMAMPHTMLMVAIFFALFFEVPTYLIGYGIHKLLNSNPKAPEGYIEPSKKPSKVKLPKRSKPKAIQKGIIPEYMEYVTKLDDLNSKFKNKEKSTRKLIEKRFEPPQLTYTKFINGVDKSSELFKKQSDTAYNLINLADEYSPRIASEIESKIDILTSIYKKLDNLANELVLTEDDSYNDDVEGVFGEMDDLINSVKDYES